MNIQDKKKGGRAKKARTRTWFLNFCAADKRKKERGFAIGSYCDYKMRFTRILKE